MAIELNGSTEKMSRKYEDEQESKFIKWVYENQQPLPTDMKEILLRELEELYEK